MNQMAMTNISANGRSIGQNMSHLRSSTELDLVGCDQHSDAVLYSKQGRNELFWNPLLVEHAESL
jgi:hypothetical protein